MSNKTFLTLLLLAWGFGAPYAFMLLVPLLPPGPEPISLWGRLGFLCLVAFVVLLAIGVWGVGIIKFTEVLDALELRETERAELELLKEYSQMALAYERLHDFVRKRGDVEVWDTSGRTVRLRSGDPDFFSLIDKADRFVFEGRSYSREEFEQFLEDSD